MMSLPELTVFTLVAPSALLSAALSAVFLPPQAIKLIPIIAIAAATANFFIFILMPSHVKSRISDIYYTSTYRKSKHNLH